MTVALVLLGNTALHALLADAMTRKDDALANTISNLLLDRWERAGRPKVLPK